MVNIGFAFASHKRNHTQIIAKRWTYALVGCRAQHTHCVWCEWVSEWVASCWWRLKSKVLLGVISVWISARLSLCKRRNVCNLVYKHLTGCVCVLFYYIWIPIDLWCCLMLDYTQAVMCNIWLTAFQRSVWFYSNGDKPAGNTCVALMCFINSRIEMCEAYSDYIVTRHHDTL